MPLRRSRSSGGCSRTWTPRTSTLMRGPGSVRVPVPSPAAESSQWTARPCAGPAQARTRRLTSWRPLDQATGTVLAQARVADKSNEIPALRELLKPLDLDGVVVSADAMHTQTDTAEWARPAWRSLRVHRQGQSEDPAQDAQEAVPEGRPVHLLGRRPSRAASAAHRPRRPGLPPGWTSPQPPRWSRSGAPEPPRIAGAQATTAALAPRGRLWRWSTWSAPYPWDRPNPSRSPPGSGDIGR